jgi:hypothetical protein
MRDDLVLHEKFVLHIEWHRNYIPHLRLYIRLLPQGGDVVEEGVLVRCFECGGEGVLIDPATDQALPVAALPQITPPDPAPTIFDIARANLQSMILFQEERPLRTALVLELITYREYTWRRLNRDYTGLPAECYEWNLLG